MPHVLPGHLLLQVPSLPAYLGYGSRFAVGMCEHNELKQDGFPCIFCKAVDN
jgi:hypothetical protein